MTTEALAVLPSTGLWDIDSNHSTMRFSVIHHATASFFGSFHPITGALDAANGSLEGHVNVDDLRVPIDRLRAHLMSDAFFDGEHHPVISFVSNSIDAQGEALEVAGTLTLRGVTRPVVAKGIVRAPMLVRHFDGSEAEHVGIDLSATIDRREFDVSYNNELPSGRLNLGWDVTIAAALELVQRS